MTHRIDRRHLLEHPVRVAIVELVRNEPGIAFLDLFGRLRPHPRFGPSIGFGSLTHHLRQLERHGLLTNRKSGRCRRYYENGGPYTGATTALSVLQTGPTAQLARLVLDSPGLSQRELWRRFFLRRPCARQAVGYHLLRMEAHELVVTAPRGRSKRYYGTERLQRLMVHVRDPSPVETAARQVPAGPRPAQTATHALQDVLPQPVPA